MHPIRSVRLSLMMSPLILVACASVDPIQPEAPQLPAHWQQQVEQDQAQRNQTKWWLEFDDAALNQLIEKALQQNYQMQADLARLRQSQAAWDRAGSGQYPDLNLTANKSRSWTESDAPNSGDTVTRDTYSLGLTTSYELDFWGSVAAQKQQGEFNYLASAQSAQIRANTLAGQVATSWYGYLKEQHNLQLLKKQQQRLSEGLETVRLRYLRGQVQVSDVWQQEQQLESLNSEMINANAALQGYQQQLALWLGQTEFSLTELGLAEADVQALPQLANDRKQLSSEALLQRPDVQAAYFNLQAANAGLAVAVANRYPRLTLTASYTGSDADIENVLDNWVANLAGGLVLPLIDGDNRRAEVRRNEAVVDEQLALYHNTLLTAVQETEQAMIDEAKQFSLNQSIDQQLALATKTERYQLNRYQKGVGDFLAYLTSQQEVLRLERQQLSANFLVLQNRVQLLKTISHQPLIATENTEGSVQ